MQIKDSNVYHVILPNDPITFDKYKHVSALDFFLLDRVIIAFSRFVYAYQYFLSLIRVNGKQNKGFSPKDKRCFVSSGTSLTVVISFLSYKAPFIFRGKPLVLIVGENHMINVGVSRDKLAQIFK